MLLQRRLRGGCCQKGDQGTCASLFVAALWIAPENTAKYWSAGGSGPNIITSATNGEGFINPTKRKRPWGAGVFLVVDLGVGGVFYISTWRLWGAGKEPREFR
jgi:hypothetical protein